MSMVNTSEPKGPRPFTQSDLEKQAAEFKKLHEERARLREQYAAHTDSREAEMREHKRIAAENRKKAEEIKESAAARLAEQVRTHESARKEDADRCAAYVRRLAEDAKRIQALENEVAALRAAAANAPAESLPAFARRLRLDAHLSTLEEEELDVALLKSMGRADLTSNMAQLGLSPAEVARVADDLFPPVAV
jgi:chromosome segregation ATPase